MLQTPLRVFTLFIFFNILIVNISSAKPVRVAVHSSFYKLVLEAFKGQFDEYEFSKLRGDKLRFLVNWKRVSERYDVVIGLDPHAITKDKHSQFITFSKLGKRTSHSDNLIPFCFSIIGFICRKSTDIDPASLESCVESMPDKSLILQNEGLSSIGKLSHGWLKTIPNLRAKQLSRVKGWSSAHKLFMSGVGQCMVGYLSSIMALDNDLYQAISLRETEHPMQYFSIGVLPYDQNQIGHGDKVRKLIDRILSLPFQQSLKTAYVFPIRQDALDEDLLGLMPPNLKKDWLPVRGENDSSP